MSKRRPLLAVAAGAVALGVVTVLLGIAEDDSVADTPPVIVCIDSTVSTNGVREAYLPEVKDVARAAAGRQARFYAAACGANATGSVDWPVHKRFASSFSSDELAKEQVDYQLEGVTKDLKRIARTPSKLKGTPFGEMLAVAARQCEQVGGACSIYMFTDGEWADKLLRVKDGVTESEEARYVNTYAPQLGNLSGTMVNFVGVGFGTHMGEVHLSEAEAVASALVQAAGGEIGDWTVRR